jgi:hypothetical protein
MRAQTSIPVPADRIAEFCRKWQIVDLALFGSILRADFGPESDVDVLVTFAPEARHNVFALIRMQQDLEELLGRKVDLVDRRVLEQDPNYVRREAILASAESIYGS